MPNSQTIILDLLGHQQEKTILHRDRRLKEYPPSKVYII